MGGSATSDSKISRPVLPLLLLVDIICCKVGRTVGCMEGAPDGEVRHSCLAYPHFKTVTGTPIDIAMACIIAFDASVPDQSV